MGCHSLLQGVFLTQGSNLGLLHCNRILYHLSHQASHLSAVKKNKLSKHTTTQGSLKDITSGKCFIQKSATAKSLQSCPTLCNPIDGSPLGSSVPGIIQATTLEWVAISFSNAWKWIVKMKSLSRVWLLVTPWTAAYQAPPSMDFPGKSTGVGCHCLLWYRRVHSLQFNLHEVLGQAELMYGGPWGSGDGDHLERAMNSFPW